MDISTIRNFFQAAPMIYASVARLAAEQATGEQVEQLAAIQKSYRQTLSAGLVEETAMHNHRFHEAIGRMAGSPYLMPSLNRLLIDHTPHRPGLLSNPYPGRPGPDIQSG